MISQQEAKQMGASEVRHARARRSHDALPKLSALASSSSAHLAHPNPAPIAGQHRAYPAGTHCGGRKPEDLALPEQGSGERSSCS